MTQAFIIKDTKKYGSGCFARKSLKRHELIHTMHGKTISLSQMVALVTHGKERIDDPLQVGRRTYVDLDTTSRSFNHSCEPNAGIRDRNSLVAIRDIQPGEEITYDYSLTIAPTSWSMRCKCGARICRKMLGDIRSVPKARVRWYMEHGAIQRYMRQLLPSILAGTYCIPAYEVNALSILGEKKQNV